MSQIRILICRVNENNPDNLTEIASYDLPEMDTLNPEIALDEAEAMLHKQGQSILQRALQAQFEEVDRDLAEAYRQDFPPSSGDERWICGGKSREPFRATGTESAGAESQARA
ncbi:MAG: hypothetical protein KBG20_01145 [Caldilineaceae bacterium]|nr:hypothetical protein [Caldilineaceae bacterium]MBP8106592.1 hypothetical protein [Caldilineaceae bacterium]MBP8121299.1 hypothetical protein [Caldilineaceae bacterium]MBP9070865.1 hypothetical protein [Caldilineaceae bacterium]